MPKKNHYTILAAEYLTGGLWRYELVYLRLQEGLGLTRQQATQLAQALWQNPAPSSRQLQKQLSQNKIFSTWLNNAQKHRRSIPLPDPSLASHSALQLAPETLPTLHTETDLAQWLNLTIGQTHWLADTQTRACRDRISVRHHYLYQWIRKSSGELRLLEAPKWRLKIIQKKILTSILNKIPQHPRAHGFRKGYSTLTHATQHCEQKAVLILDLTDFFAHITQAHVRAIFSAFGYRHEVASLLAGLCVNNTSATLAGQHFRTLDPRSRQRLRTPHLPQGAPTSPSLANLAAWRFDARVTALCDSASFNYSRYADDIAISGNSNLYRHAATLEATIGAIALDEGLHLNHRKSRLLGCGTQQNVTGIVVNQKPNLSRQNYDQLKAILHNCQKYGPTSQNRQNHPYFAEHLRGRISQWQHINPARGRKLLVVWKTIDWNL